MLVLSRKVGEAVVIGDGIVVRVLTSHRGQLRLGITAPPSVHIRREELPERPGQAPRRVALADGGGPGGSNPARERCPADAFAQARAPGPQRRARSVHGRAGV